MTPTRVEYVASLGITYSATFVPQSASRNRGDKKPSLNWTVTLTRNGYTLTTDYMQGIGHVPERRELPRTLYFEPLRKDVDAASETGKYPVNAIRARQSGLLDVQPYRLAPLPVPSLLDVLYSLLMDASAGEEPFEDFCSNCGYDTDSRKAEAMWRACVDTNLRLRRMFTADELATLQTLFADY